MAQYVSRDKMWNFALKNDRVQPARLAEAFGTSERTARDTLETMHEMGWLEKEGGVGTTPAVYHSNIDVPDEEVEKLA